MSSIRVARFVVLNAVGALIWAVTVGLLGYVAGGTVERLLGDIKHAEKHLLLGILLVGAAVWGVYLLRKKRGVFDVTLLSQKTRDVVCSCATLVPMKTLVGGSVLACAVATAVVAGEPTVGAGASFRGPVGLQLYSLRDDFKKDVPGTLDAVKAYGFKYVELAGTYGLTPVRFREMLDARGLVAVAAHFSIDRYLQDPDGIAAEVGALGVTYVGVAWYGHKAPFDEAQCLKMAADFNAAGKAMAERDLRFFYHNHGYEFQPHGDGTLFDLLMARTDPRFVTFEMDILWTVHPGQNPVELLERYGSRWELVHLKDLRKGVTGDLSGHTDVRNDVALGTGQVDFPAVLAAARKAGVKWFFIEDESPTMRDQISESLKFLQGVSW